MSDTPENQATYPQHSNQAPGCGFPIAKIVVMFSLVTGAGMEVLIAVFKTSVVVLARQLYKTLMPGEVLLADSLHVAVFLKRRRQLQRRWELT